MKLGFKNILIIFIVALLGAGIGTYGMLNAYNQNTSKEDANENDPIVLNQIEYNNKQETNYTKAIDKAYNTVVEINCTVVSQTSNYFFFGNQEQYGTASGSGVIISEDGYIVTNNHVVEDVAGEDAVKVKLYNDEIYDAKIIGTDSRTDLAVLKINAKGLPYSNFVDSSTLVMGEDVIVIGNPLGLGICCSNGIVSALEKEIYINNVYLTVIQTNAAVNAGNSGGGLFDLNGNIVGIVNAKSSSSTLTEASVEGMGYAIPSNTVQRIVKEIIEFGYVKDRASLGVRVYTGSSYNVNGVIITEVTEGGGAYQAGLQANDIITAINGIGVSSYADLSKILDSKKVADEVTVTVERDGVAKDFIVVLQQSVSN